MDHPSIAPFAPWESFYVIIGSSAAALTGLQFVVVTLGAEGRAMGERQIKAYGTPTIVHFVAVLVASAILSAPWGQVAGAAYGLAALSLVGFVHTFVGLRHARLQSAYAPVLEDWIFHTVLPLVAYGTLLASASLLPSHSAGCLFLVGGAVLLLLVVGIHNAWDSVTYIATTRRKAPE